jgi:hypothetical protein
MRAVGCEPILRPKTADSKPTPNHLKSLVGIGLWSNPPRLGAAVGTHGLDFLRETGPDPLPKCLPERSRLTVSRQHRHETNHMLNHKTDWKERVDLMVVDYVRMLAGVEETDVRTQWESLGSDRERERFRRGIDGANMIVSLLSVRAPRAIDTSTDCSTNC